MNNLKKSGDLKKEKASSIPVTVADNTTVGNGDPPEFGWKEHHRPEWALSSPIQDVFCRYGGYYS